MKEENVKKRIGFDLDGVLADHAKNRRKISKNPGIKEGCREVKELIYGEISLTADIIKGAQKAVKILEKDFELFVISRRQQKHSKYAGIWLKKNFNFASKNIFFVEKDEDKARVIKKLGLDFFIDDKMSVLIHIRGGTKKFLFDEAGAYKKGRYGGIKAVRSFEEFLEEIIRYWKQ